MAEMLVGLKVIAARFAVRKFTVKKWAQAGAPIVIANEVDGKGARYRADYDKLYDWLAAKTGTPGFWRRPE